MHADPSRYAASTALCLLVVGACDLRPDVRIREADAGSCLPSACAGACDTITGECVDGLAATCPLNRDVDCVRYVGLPLCDDGLCDLAQCNSDLECRVEASNAQCVSHRCVVSGKGCVGGPDDRSSVDEKGNYELTIFNLVSNQIPPDLKVTLCGSSNDFNCTTPPPSAKAMIDATRNVLRITDLAPNTQIHLQLRASGVFDAEFYSQRTVKGDTVEPVALGLIPRSLGRALQMATDVPTDTDNATVLARIFDCSDRPAAGVKLSSSRFHPAPKGGTDTRVFYLKEGNLPDADATSTTALGAAGIVNLNGNKQTTLSAILNETLVAQLALIPKAGWITYVHLYPRDYTK